MITGFIDWFWRDRHTGQIVIAQWPNIWLWIFVTASIFETITKDAGSAVIIAHSVATVSLAVWAGDEILRGVNPWRRCLGVAVSIGLASKLVT